MAISLRDVLTIYLELNKPIQGTVAVTDGLKLQMTIRDTDDNPVDLTDVQMILEATDAKKTVLWDVFTVDAANGIVSADVMPTVPGRNEYRLRARIAEGTDVTFFVGYIAVAAEDLYNGPVGTITSLSDRLEEAASAAEAAADRTNTIIDSSSVNAERAESAAVRAETSEAVSSDAAVRAENAAAGAAQSEGSAATAAEGAEGFAVRAENAANSAEASAVSADSDADRAEAARENMELWRDMSLAAAADAQNSKAAAAASEVSAANDALSASAGKDAAVSASVTATTAAATATTQAERARDEADRAEEAAKGAHGLPTGGADGQLLVKDGAADYGARWDTPAGSGDVTGPNAAGNGNVVLFDGTTGKAVKDSGIGIASLLPPAVATDAPPAPTASGTVGISAKYAREDHAHPAQTVPVASALTPMSPTATGNVGTALTFARGDHAHPKQSVAYAEVTGTPDVYTKTETDAKYIAAAEKGAAGGVATLDGTTGQVPFLYIPVYSEIEVISGVAATVLTARKPCYLINVTAAAANFITLPAYLSAGTKLAFDITVAGGGLASAIYWNVQDDLFPVIWDTAEGEPLLTGYQTQGVDTFTAWCSPVIHPNRWHVTKTGSFSYD